MNDMIFRTFNFDDIYKLGKNKITKWLNKSNNNSISH